MSLPTLYQYDPTTGSTAAVERDDEIQYNEDGQPCIEVPNTTTGEIELVPLSEIDGVKQAGYLGRAVANIEKTIEWENRRFKADIQTLTEQHNYKVGQLNGRIDRLMESAEVLIGELHAQKLLPTDKKKRPSLDTGVGVFKFKSGTPSVDTTMYDDMSEDGQGNVHADFPDLFQTKVIITPKKAEIKKAIKAGQDGTVPECFILTTPEDRLEFKS